ncbi:DUF411 domain-containing protein [Methyloglobulus sp.]|uniref:DUF411 domain-containing protein n=1 Tax=Methyloglobulus sp. TaxID=2518622 RepID=UPI0032B7ECAF
MKKVKHFLAATLLLNAGFAWADVAQAEEKIDIVVNRSPTCSCCGKWVEHLKQNNFNVKDVVSDDVQAIKDKYGVTQELASCHTALVNGYVVEGHVPAKDIRTLLKNKPDVVGITVPGMPSGTPGMEMGGKKDAYQVISFDKKNQHQVFSNYQAE